MSLTEESPLDELLKTADEMIFDQDVLEEDSEMSLRRAIRREKAASVHRKREKNVCIARWRAQKITRAHKKAKQKAAKEPEILQFKRRLKRLRLQANQVCRHLEARYGLRYKRTELKKSAKGMRYRRITKITVRAA